MMDKLFTSLVAGLLLLFLQFPAYSSPGDLPNLKDGNHNDILSLTSDPEMTPGEHRAMLEGLTISIPDIDVQPGGSFCLDVSVNGFMSILGMQFSLVYDPAVLTFDAVQNINLDGLNLAQIGTPPDETAPGTITLSWLDPALSGLSVPNGTVIFQLCFTAANTDATTTVDFSNSPTLIEIIDGDENSVMFTGDAGTVTVGAGGNNGGGGNNGDFTMTLSDETTNPGGAVCVDVSVDGFTNILGMQFSLAYDPAVLTFSAIQNINLDGLSLAQIGTPPDETAPGSITLSWLDPALSGLSVPDGTVIFQVCFTAANTDATTTVEFSNSPTLIEITDGDENNVPFNGMAGTVTVGTGVNNGGGGNNGDFTMTLSDETTNPGGAVCVDVSVDGFTNILGMQFSLAYDPAVLTFSAIQNINLDGLSLTQIGTPPDETAPGSITLSWLDPALSGLSVPDGTVIFQACFTAANTDATTTVDFSNSPTLIEITDGDENNVPFNGVAGTVTIGGGGGGGNPDGFTITLSDETVTAGNQVCVDVSVANFTNILGMQFSLSYNPAALEFDAIQNINLDGLNLAQIGTPPDETAPGTITLSWLDPALEGLDLPNGTVIFQLCFTAIGPDGATTVDFSNSPTLIEITDGNENNVPFNGVAGTVTIGGGGGGGNPDGFTITLSDETVTAGNQVCVDVSVANFTNILGMQFSLSYNPAALEFDAIQNINLDGLNLAQIGTPPDETAPGTITLSWLDPALEGLDLPNGTVIFQLCFTAIGPDGATMINFSNTPTLIEITDGNENNVPFNGVAGTVTIGGGGGGGNPDGFTITLSDETADPGQQVCVDVSVANFTNILGMQFSLSYNPAALEFDAIQNINLDGLNLAQIGTPPDETAPGTITLSWLDPALEGLDLPNGTVIFQLCFTAIGPDGATTINFSNTPTLIEITDGDENNVPFNGVSGTVTIGGGGGNPDGFTITLSDETADPGQQVCVDVSVANFTNILGMQFSLSYDPAALEFDAIQNINLDGLNLAQIGTPPDETAPGTITLSWLDPALEGLDLPNGTVIFQLCFTVIGPSGTTTIDFSNTPTLIEITDGNEDPVPFNGVAGTITIGDGEPPPNYDNFTFVLDDVSVESGDQFCLDVEVYNFVNVVGMQFSINYDPALLTFVSVGNFNLNGLNTGQFGLPGDGDVTAGNVTLVWVEPGLEPVTLPDGTVIFEICFEATGPNGTTTNVNISGSPTPIEVSDSDDNVLVVDTESSTVNISTVVPPAASATVTNVDCFGNGNGAINLSVSGGTGNYVYTWTGPGGFTSSQQDISGLDGGTYNVTIDDQTSGFNSNFSFVVGEPNAPVGVGSVNISDVSCGAPNNGSITVFGTGGTNPLTYTWDQGLPNGPIQNNLFPATYNLTITDVRGCQVTAQFTVDDAPAPVISNTVVADIQNGNDGAVNITVTGGTGSFSYSWQGPGGFTSSQQDLSNLSVPGDYCVTITDNGNGCTTVSCAAIVEKLRFGQIIMTPSCSGESEGSLQVQIFGGQPPIQYEWRNAATQELVGTSPQLTGQPPGIYELYVFDSAGDELNGTFEITAIPAIQVTAAIQDVEGDISLATGSISLTFPGGGSPAVVWADGPTGPVRQNLTTGEYCATITPQDGCVLDTCFTVGFVPAPLAIVEVETASISCAGDSDGQLIIDFFGGFPPYTINVAGESFQTDMTSFTIDGLPAGSYNVVIVDGEGSSASINNLQVTEPAPISATATVLHDTEESGCGGRITLDINGGTPGPGAGYSVQWNTPSLGNPLINLCEGQYFPTITDGNGCQITLDAIEVNTFALAAEVTNADCPDDATGLIDLLINGGEADFTITWQDALTNEILTTEEDLADVPPGNYIVTVSEGSGNVLTRLFTVGSESDLAVELEVLTNYNGFDVSCADSEDAILEATGLNSDGNYAYEWTQNDLLLGTDATLENVGAGTYQVNVIDGLGCVVSREIEVGAPPVIQLTAVIQGVSCAGQRDGEIEVVATGGALGTSFLYQWDNGAVGSRRSFLGSGSYTVTAADVNNCTMQRTFEVTAPDPIVVSVTTQPAEDGCNGTAEAVVTGGTPPYTYEWNAPASPGQGFITGLCPGEYFVSVTDSRGCTHENQGVSGLVRDRRFDCIETKKVITPDGDGLNEAFIISCSDEFNDNRLEIYDRWGQPVFAADNYTCITPSGPGCWQGRHENGTDLPEGPYYYVFEYTGPEGDRIQVKGSITLLRD